MTTEKLKTQTINQTTQLDSSQVTNNAGGYVYEVSDDVRLLRFLILGAEGGTYYSQSKDLHRENITCIDRMIMQERGVEAVELILDVSKNGRAIKQDSVLYALAICARSHDSDTKAAAYTHLNEICRIPTHLFKFVKYCEVESAGTGWGRLHRRSISNWYITKGSNNDNVVNLARLITKFAKREGWTHKDIFRLCHIQPKKMGKPVQITVVYAIKGLKEAEAFAAEAENKDNEHVQEIVKYLRVVEKAKSITKKNTDNNRTDELVELITDCKLSREQVSNTMLSEVKVWQALLEHMPVEAMVRNLGNMSHKKVLISETKEEKIVLDTLSNELKMKRARMHPFKLLVALKTYSKGMGEYGHLSWDKNPKIIDALETAFYRSFKYAEPTGKRFLLAIDVSGSMNVNLTNSPSVTARDAAAAMAMLTVRTEKPSNCIVIPFSHTQPRPIDIRPEDKLLDVHAKCMRYHFGRTDCSLPMKYAMENRLDIDVFIVYTDSETYYGNTHPTYALKEYRRTTGITDAKLIVVGMTSSGFTIADPEDPNMMDMVGFDANAPEIINQFVLDFKSKKLPEEEPMDTEDIIDIHG